MINATIEDYLKTIYEVENELGKVATTILARELDITPASATGMIKKLAEMNLVSYTPYRGVILTPEGKKIALTVLRHHRLIELFLVKTLGLSWDEVHAEAEKLEHVLSERLEMKIDAFLGYPSHDPHGAPIPQKDGQTCANPQVRLSELEAGDSAVIAQVKDRDAELLRYIGGLGLFPNVFVQVKAVAPFRGPIALMVGEAECSVGYEVAYQIYVTPSPSE